MTHNNDNKKFHTHIGRLFVLSALTLGVNQALAQEATGTKDKAIEVIEVSATKRPASIQDVPVSVAVVSAETMDKVGINDMEDLSIVIPNFEINSAAILPNLYVRGLGGGTSHSIEQSVGRFVDDVYISRAAINLHPFMDIEAVEVLRGPQGTLFGKNTAAGAMIVRTANTDDIFGYGIDVSASSFATTGGTRELSGYMTGALTDDVQARLSFLWKDKDGYYKNLFDGPNGADREDKGIRAKFLWQAGDNTTVGLKLEYMTYDEIGSDTAEINAFGGPPLDVWKALTNASGAVTDDGSPGGDVIKAELDWEIYMNCGPALSNPAAGGTDIGSFCPSREQDSTNVTLNIEHEFEAGVLSIISAYQQYEYSHGFHGLDMGAANLFRAIRDEEYSGFSQELRFTSDESDTFDYIAGIYYEDSDLTRGQTSHFNTSALPFAAGGRQWTEEEPWSQDTTTIAIFGQGRWKIDEDWTAIIGGRYATEDKDYTFERFFNVYQTNTLIDQSIRQLVLDPALEASIREAAHEDSISPRNETRTESKFTPSFTLQWQASDDVNVYATYSQGHKTGGFSDRVEGQNSDIEFDAEEVTSFEIGTKSTWFDGTLNLNATYFNMDIEGLQLATQVEGSVAAFSVDNAADSSSVGIELELLWYATDNFTFGANYANTDATYDEFIGAADCDDSLRNTDGVCDLTGQPLIFAPESKASLFLEYYGEDMLGEWDISGRTDISFTGDQFTDITYTDVVQQKAFETYNASLRLISPDEDIVISLIGKNLSNERIMAWGVPSGPNTLAAMAPPREIELKLKYRY